MINTFCKTPKHKTNEFRDFVKSPKRQKRSLFPYRVMYEI